MIVLVLVLGGWLGWIARSARIQREVLAAIRKARAVFTTIGNGKTGNGSATGGRGVLDGS